MSRLPASPLAILAFAAGFSVIVPGNVEAQARSTVAAAAAPHRDRDAGRHAVAVGARGLLDRKADLGLTADQLRLLDVIARRYDDQDKLLRDDKGRAASRAAEQKEVNAILTDDQREKIREPAPAAEQARRK